MKNRIIFVCFLFLYSLAGCFDDEGNYNYKDLNGPVFKAEEINVYAYQEEPAEATSDFYFEKDSAERLANVRYEWTLNGMVISEERDLNVPTDTLIKRAGITKFAAEALGGFFIVIEKTTGIRYMSDVYYYIRPKYFAGDWLILSENGGNTKLSFVKRKIHAVDGGTDYYYEVHDDLYKELNGEEIPGVPRRIRYSQGKNISASQGSATIITDKVVYELNNENMLKAYDLKDEFLGGVPTDFSAIDVFHSEKVSYLAMEDGRLFRRTMSANWLGGQYINVPYAIDNKGCELQKFGLAGTYKWSFVTPCYDRLNRRVMMIKNESPFTIMPVTKGQGQPVLPVWGMDEGTEVLYLAQMRNVDLLWTNPYYLFTLVYNQGGKTYLSDFAVNYNTGECIDTEKLDPNSIEIDRIIKPVAFPGGNLDKDSRFITSIDESGTPGKVVLYTKGNEIRYVNKSNLSDHPVLSFGAKITMLCMTSYNYNSGQLAIGLENGEFMMVNISSLDAPYVYEESRVNLGGRVVDGMEYRGGLYSYDNY